MKKSKSIKTKLLLFVSVIMFSCNQDKISHLDNQIAELKIENEILKDSISEIELNNITSFYILGKPQKNKVKVNEKAKIDFDFMYRSYIKEYNVYLLNGKNGEERELVLENLNISEFDYSYTPKDKTDNQINLMLVFDLGNVIVEVPAEVTLNVTD